LLWVIDDRIWYDVGRTVTTYKISSFRQMQSYSAVETSYLVECSSHFHIISNQIPSDQCISTGRSQIIPSQSSRYRSIDDSQISPSQTSKSRSQTMMSEHLKPVLLCKHSRGTRHLHSGKDIFLETSLGTSVSLLDVLAVLIGVHGGALVDGIVLPVAIVDLVDGEIRAIVGQVLQGLGSLPTRNVLTYVELASGDGLQIRELGEHNA
jgi:hypothetical protein